MIWCVEDDASIRDIEVYTLKSMGFDAVGFEDGEEFRKALKHGRPDLIILDVMLPGEDGIDILKKLKSSNLYSDIPIIMATAKGSEYEKVEALDIGADDYLVKPFGMMEMVSRVKAVLRRGAPRRENVLKCADMIMNLEERTVFIGQEKIALTFKEFEILKLFLSNPGSVFSREMLFEQVWQMGYLGETRTVDMHIRSLRRKLGEYGNLIETVRNVGYKIEAKND
ncbi:MAG: response regulator transcription factor [Anaerofustis stercorihominis]|nr:response regulator transcription factor [Anaerofustis stercorihominis]